MAAIFAAGALCVVFTRGIYQAVASLPREAALLTLLLGGLALLVLCICGALVFQSVRKEEPVERSWLVYPLLVAAGLLFSLLLPPLSGPDEPSHYATAYRYSNVLLGRSSVLEEPERESIGYVFYNQDYRGGDGDLIRAYANLTEVDYDHFYAPAYENVALLEENTRLKGAAFASYPYTVIGYLPAIAGLTLGRVLGLSAVIAAFLGRTVNLLLTAGVMTSAIRNTPRGGRILLMAALFPMTLHLIGTFSPDGLMVGVAFLAFRGFMELLEGKEKLTFGATLPFAACCALASMLKLYCAPLCLLILLVPAGRFRKKITWVFSALVALLFTLGGVVLGNFDALAGVFSETAVAYTGEAYTLGDVLAKPLFFGGMFIRSLIKDIPMLAMTIAGYSLGAFTVQLPSYFYALCYLVLILVAALPEKQDALPAKKCLLWCLPIGLLALLPAYGSMLLWWTPVDSPYILGVQGRYFLPVLPLLVSALSALPCKIYRADTWCLALICGLNSIGVLLMLRGILL